jgi:hypothetical protein
MKRRRPEDVLQRQIVQYLDATLAGHAWFTHVPNGGRRSPIEAAIMKGLGVKPGVPDLLIIDGGRAHWLEVKRPDRKARTSDNQNDCHDALLLARCNVAVVQSLEEVEALLLQWGVPLRARLAVPSMFGLVTEDAPL